MKVNCPICKGSKTCHIVSSNRTEYHNEHGIDWVTKAKLQIHKHRRGQNMCKGSEKIISISSLEDAKLQKKYLFKSKITVFS